MALSKVILILVCLAAVLSQSSGSAAAKHHFLDKFAALAQINFPKLTTLPPIDPLTTPTFTDTEPTIIDTPTTDLTDEIDPLPITDLTDSILPLPVTNIDTITPTEEPSESPLNEMGDGFDGDASVDESAAPESERSKPLGDYYAHEDDNLFEKEIPKVKESSLTDAQANPDSISLRQLYNRRSQLLTPQQLRLRKQQKTRLYFNRKRVQLSRRRQAQKYRRLLAKYKRSLQQRRRLINEINKRRSQIIRLRHIRNQRQ